MDQLSVFRTILVNAVRAKHKFAVVNGTKMNKRMLDVMKEEGYISEYSEVKNSKFKKFKVYFNIFMSPVGYRYAFKDMKQISKPGLKNYKKHNEIFHVQNGKGSSIVSTSQGVMEGSKARKSKLGGEHLLNIYS